MKSKTFNFALICILLFPFSSAAGYILDFIPRFSITEEYSDNIFLAEEDEQDDFITTISAAFKVEILGKFSGMNFSYDPSYAFYDDFSENDTLRHRGRLNAWTDLTNNTSLELRDAFLRTEEPFTLEEISIVRGEEPLLPEDPTIRKKREPYYRNIADLRLNHQFGESDNFYLGYVYRILENDDPDVEDKKRHSPSIGLNYWFTSQFGLETSASYTRGKYDKPDFADVPYEDDFDNWYGNIKLINKFSKYFEGYIQYAHTVRDFDERNTEDYNVYDSSIGINYAVAEDFNLTLGVGYFIQDRETSDDETGAIINADLGKTWRLKRGRVNISGSSGYHQSDFGAENLGFEQFYKARFLAVYGLTKRITGDINIYYRRDEYINLEDNDREDETWRGGVGLTFKPLKWLSCKLKYSYRKVDSSEDYNDYAENRVFIRVTLSPSLPFRISQ